MNPIKAIINDLKSDAETVGEIFTGKYKTKYTMNDVKKAVKDAIKDPMSYVFIILIIAAFLSGILYSGKYWQDKANSFVIDTCMEQVSIYNPGVLEHLFDNYTLEQSEEENKIDGFVLRNS
jgi:hypothetical protein